MKITFGEKGLKKTWQRAFLATTKCCRCPGTARIAFVAHEGMDPDDRRRKFVTRLHANKGKGGYWPHDRIAVAVYFCQECCETTALYNQA
jgi:hypothetical protein